MKKSWWKAFEIFGNSYCGIKRNSTITHTSMARVIGVEMEMGMGMGMDDEDGDEDGDGDGGMLR